MRTLAMISVGLACAGLVGCTHFSGRLHAIGKNFDVEIELPEVPSAVDETTLPEPTPPVMTAPKKEALKDVQSSIPSANKSKPTHDKTVNYVHGGMDGDKPAEFACDEKNFYWIQGRVSRVHLGREKVWKVRYAPYDKVDPYGGSLVLKGPLPSDLEDGDLIRAEGIVPEKTQENRAAEYRCHRVIVLAKKSQESK